VSCSAVPFAVDMKMLLALNIFWRGQSAAAKRVCHNDC
jgi:hypothetical protein